MEKENSISGEISHQRPNHDIDQTHGIFLRSLVQFFQNKAVVVDQYSSRVSVFFSYLAPPPLPALTLGRLGCPPSGLDSTRLTVDTVVGEYESVEVTEYVDGN